MFNIGTRGSATVTRPPSLGQRATMVDNRYNLHPSCVFLSEFQHLASSQFFNYKQGSGHKIRLQTSKFTSNKLPYFMILNVSRTYGVVILHRK